MTTLPAAYAWLARERHPPKTIAMALPLLGTIEASGRRDNPTILAWAREVGGKVADVYTADAIPWCGLFAAVVAQRAGWPLPPSPLWALSWSAFGRPVDDPGLGDVLVFVRRTPEGRRAGHVGFYVGEDVKAFHVLGGNQADAVTITRIARSRFYAARRPIWRRAQPQSVRPIHLAPKGALSSNEA